MLWCKVTRSNNDPRMVAYFFVNYLMEIHGAPRCVRMDAGTENVIIADLQKLLRNDDERSVLIGNSHSNQRIEMWWAINRRQNSQYWMDLFHELDEQGIISTARPFHMFVHIALVKNSLVSCCIPYCGIYEI